MAFAFDTAFLSESERRNNRMAFAAVGRNNHVTITSGGLGNWSHPNSAVWNHGGAESQDSHAGWIRGGGRTAAPMMTCTF